MSNCSNHRKDVHGESDMRHLAEEIGNLHYETLAELLNRLSEKLYSDYLKDKEAGRIELAQCLLWIHHGINKASYGAERAWRICMPFMLNSDKNVKASVATESDSSKTDD